MRRLLIAIALAGFGFGVAHAAEPFDGRWRGSWSGTSSTAGAEGRGCTNYSGNIDMTVANGEVTGETTGQFSGPISGRVANDGKFTGQIGGYAMTGTFSPKGFKGRITGSKCIASASAKAQTKKP